MEFKDKLKGLRKEKGLSQQALADAIFISRSAVAKWENGLGLPNQESMQALIAFFGVSKEYFTTDKPEEVLMEKNKQIRRMALWLTICGAVLGLLLVLLLASIPVVNDLTAAQVKKRLENIPLPETTARIEAISKAGKMTGNGNGMQYLGAILLESDLTMEQLNSYYHPYRSDQWDCLIKEYHGGQLEFVSNGHVQFDAELEPNKQYYVVYSWGSGLDVYKDLDLRGH